MRPRKSVEDRLRSYDRHLSLRWDAHLERWVLIRYIPNAVGRYNVVKVIQGPQGEFKEPTEHWLMDWLGSNDMARMGGGSHADRVKRYIREKNVRNEQIKRDMRRVGIDRRYELFMDWQRAAERWPDDPEKVRRYMLSRSELLDEMDVSRSERAKIESGMLT